MGARTSGREAALQVLFAMDVTGSGSEQALAAYWREVPGDPDGREFADALVRGVEARREVIDDAIRAASRHWRLERMARVDRNVLRLGVLELLAGDDVPRAVVIDEAVELAKRYGSEASGVFVNGVLARIAEELAGPKPP